jgi:ribosome-associated heat shock protein Hsp15
MTAESLADKQRLDKWLWFARVVKTRSLAAKLVAAGHVRVNSERMESPAKSVRTGDVLTIALERQVRVLKILGSGTRRGPFEEAKLLFEDLSPPPPPKDEQSPQRDAGAGRPTKHQRRAIHGFLDSLT